MGWEPKEVSKAPGKLPCTLLPLVESLRIRSLPWARALSDHCELLLAGLVIRTRSKPAAVGSPSKKDDKSTANGDDAEKTKASDEVPPFLSAFVFRFLGWESWVRSVPHCCSAAVTGSGPVARKTRVVACACACEGQNLTKCVLVLQAEDAYGDEEKEDERDVRPSFLGV